MNSINTSVATTSKKKTWYEQQIKMLNTVLSASTDFIYVFDRDGRCLYASEIGLQAFGLAQSDMIGKTWRELGLPEEHLAGFERHRKKAMVTGRTIKGETDFPTLEGIRRFEYTVKPVIDEAGDADGVVIVVSAHDVTDVRRTNEELAVLLAREQETRRMEQQTNSILQTLIETLPAGIIITDATGKVISANRTAKAIMRNRVRQDLYHIDTLEGDVEMSYYLADGSPLSLNELPLAQALSKGIVTPELELTLRWADGQEVSVLAASAPVRDEQGNIVLGVSIFQDITERNQMLEALREGERRKDEFIGMASHELKTPITTIKAFAQFLQRTFAKQGLEEPVEFLGKMDAQINKLTKLVNDLLDVSRIQAGKMALVEEPFDFDSMIKDIVESVQRTADAHHIGVSGSLGREVIGDKDRIGQVMTNLLTNAIKYSPRANRIDVQITPEQSRVVVSVRDYGIGIAKQHIDKLFERFYRVYSEKNKTYPGLGIGLYISHEIVKRHGGEMWVESVEGQGSTFYFALPLQ